MAVKEKTKANILNSSNNFVGMRASTELRGKLEDIAVAHDFRFNSQVLRHLIETAHAELGEK